MLYPKHYHILCRISLVHRIGRVSLVYFSYIFSVSHPVSLPRHYFDIIIATQYYSLCLSAIGFESHAQSTIDTHLALQMVDIRNVSSHYLYVTI